MKTSWGILGPEALPNTRRSRTLGLGASVRNFNDRAVPGLGGAWFGKQILLALLGVVVADIARKDGYSVSNIEVANAIEALACCLAFESNGWSKDPRLRGSTKLRGKVDDLSFNRLREPSFYVSQPMRTASVQTLPALGLVETGSVRFNDFIPTEIGMQLIEQAWGEYKPQNRQLENQLALWIADQVSNIRTDPVINALSPITGLKLKARRQLENQLKQNSNTLQEFKGRRANALEWVNQLESKSRKSFEWRDMPDCIQIDHWRDLEGGARFFEARSYALGALDSLEAHMANNAAGVSYTIGSKIPDAVVDQLKLLKKSANSFLDMELESDNEATYFLSQCSKLEYSKLLELLVVRDQVVLRLDGNEIKPGPAFNNASVQVSSSDVQSNGEPLGSIIPLPDGISYRIQNLFLLNVDMLGKLGEWIELKDVEVPYEA